MTQNGVLNIEAHADTSAAQRSIEALADDVAKLGNELGGEQSQRAATMPSIPHLLAQVKNAKAGVHATFTRIWRAYPLQWGLFLPGLWRARLPRHHQRRPRAERGENVKTTASTRTAKRTPYVRRLSGRRFCGAERRDDVYTLR